MRGRQGELKYSAARFIRLCPQPAPMGIDDRRANRQSHPHSAGLRGVKRLENAIEMTAIAFNCTGGPEPDPEISETTWLSIESCRFPRAREKPCHAQPKRRAQ